MSDIEAEKSQGLDWLCNHGKMELCPFVYVSKWCFTIRDSWGYGSTENRTEQSVSVWLIGAEKAECLYPLSPALSQIPGLIYRLISRRGIGPRAGEWQTFQATEILKQSVTIYCSHAAQWVSFSRRYQDQYFYLLEWERSSSLFVHSLVNRPPLKKWKRKVTAINQEFSLASFKIMIKSG